LTRIVRRIPRPEPEREMTDGDPTCHKVIRVNANSSDGKLSILPAG
jgi:hypothetical protein